MGSYSRSCHSSVDWVGILRNYRLCDNILTLLPGRILNIFLIPNDTWQVIPEAFTHNLPGDSIWGNLYFLSWWAFHKSHLATPPSQNPSFQKTLPPGRLNPYKVYWRRPPHNSPIVKALFQGNLPLDPMDYSWLKGLYKPLKLVSQMVVKIQREQCGYTRRTPLWNRSDPREWGCGTWRHCDEATSHVS